MKKYRCHKVVEAGKIEKILTERRPDGKTRVTIRDGGTIEVERKIFARGMPAIGDYLVRYEDGYISWSPAKAFEAGYTLLEE